MLFLFPILALAASRPTDRSLAQLARSGNSEAWTALRERAAEGDAQAQVLVGRMYEVGKGVKQDYAEAYFWDSIAIQYPSYRFMEGQADSAAKHLTPEQISAVNKRVAEWKPKPAPIDPNARKPNLRALAGVYKYAFDNGDVSGDKYRSEDILEIVQHSPNTAYFRTHLEFFNGHQCEMWGIANIEGGDLVYRGSGMGASGVAGLKSDYEKCVLHLNISKDNITLIDDNSVCRMVSCGSRGGYGASFPRSRRRKIHYMDELLASRQYEDATKEYSLLNQTAAKPAPVAAPSPKP